MLKKKFSVTTIRRIYHVYLPLQNQQWRLSEYGFSIGRRRTAL